MPHDIKSLEVGANELWDVFGRLADRERHAELIRQWRNPGYTTPAEFHLVKEMIQSLRSQAKQLEVLQQGLIEGNRLILEAGAKKAL